MFVITNREIVKGETGLDQFGKRPNANGPMELRMAEVTRRGRGWQVEMIPDQPSRAMQRDAGITPSWLRSMGFDADEPINGSVYVARCVLDRVNPPTSGGSGRGGGRRRKGRNILVFVHGYNNDMSDVIFRAAHFEREFGVEVLVFTWPANGGGLHGVASYLSDKHDAKVSVAAFDRALAKMGDILKRSSRLWFAKPLTPRAS